MVNQGSGENLRAAAKKRLDEADAAGEVLSGAERAKLEQLSYSRVSADMIETQGTVDLDGLGSTNEVRVYAGTILTLLDRLWVLCGWDPVVHARALVGGRTGTYVESYSFTLEPPPDPNLAQRVLLWARRRVGGLTAEAD